MIQSISGLGRKFFLHSGKPSSFELDEGGRVWFEDSYSHKRIYTHYRGRWRGFTEGGTLRDLVIAMRDYIRTGQQLTHHFGPWPDWYSDGDPWGYLADMETVRNNARVLGLLPAKETLDNTSAPAL